MKVLLTLLTILIVISIFYAILLRPLLSINKIEEDEELLTNIGNSKNNSK